MADDIVTRLRTQRDEDGYCVICGDGRWESHFPKCLMCEAADEIDRLRAALTNAVKSITNRERENDELHDDLTWLLQEVGRLRAAGDALVAAIRSHDLREDHIKAWEEEARHG